MARMHRPTERAREALDGFPVAAVTPTARQTGGEAERLRGERESDCILERLLRCICHQTVSWMRVMRQRET